jgi:dGTPase
MTATVRERTEALEAGTLAPNATRAAESRGRGRPEDPCPVRTTFQRDRDRIIHCKSFRRLKGKTQVFFSPAGDHYRTRLTHTLEVAQIARTLARALRLNEDLTEAVALGHDLGHTPFGHAGEHVLDELLPGGFHHSRQSLRVVERLENDGRGLNLTAEVLDGIVHHTKGAGEVAWTPGGGSPSTLEGEVVRFSDVIAYLNHDLDDALRAGFLDPGDLPPAIVEVLGDTHSRRIGGLVKAVVEATEVGGAAHVAMSREHYDAMNELRTFLYDRVYNHPEVLAELRKARSILVRLWEALVESDELRGELISQRAEDADDERAVADFIAGMTDAFAVDLHARLHIPKRWYHP